MQVTTIGLDIAKNVFQVHGIDAAEKVVVRKQLRRSQVGRGTCQQDGPHRLGIAGQGRPLSGACTGGSGLRGLAMGG